eukprot:1273701-Karenia_brevis.AAC.1
MVCFGVVGGCRNRGHPRKRWSDDLDAFFGAQGLPRDSWKNVAQSRDTWHNLEDSFVAQSWYR